MTDWDGILARNGPAVWRCAYRLLGRREDAEDCFQETFVAALDAFARGPVENERALLLRLATARAMDKLRGRYRRAKREGTTDWESLGGIESTDLQPSDHAEAAELSGLLREALATLPPRQADVFCLHCLEGWSYQEVADHLGATVDAIGVLLHRARAKLKTLLAAAAPHRSGTGRGRQS